MITREKKRLKEKLKKIIKQHNLIVTERDLVNDYVKYIHSDIRSTFSIDKKIDDVIDDLLKHNLSNEKNKNIIEQIAKKL